MIADFRAGRPLDISGLAPWIANILHVIFHPYHVRFVRSDDAIYPPDVARQIKHGTRVMVTCGTADTNVPCWTTPPLLAALKHTSGPGLKVLAGLDHLFHPAGTPVGEQILAPAARQALHEFARPGHRIEAAARLWPAN
ncbi:hypothetical protein JOF56_009694 [Kibdelosporangium banguiense]|uniref:Peptidase S9 prolyl oligopeptidase catalytic domain-containing protein n=1 Tax=Kibdelosporangium banguiense TaxID=1365924 RepID=A0ABS4TY44_9PSEU|nr:hypothetical protein [Kibdelosporangium banguiense]MBP2329309.1 hypothetical protein [Kibdelosporangium banguiense]